MEPNKISKELQEAYKQEFAKGVKLFQASLTEYEETGDFAMKKAMLKDVMDKALDVINQAAKGFLSKKDLKQDELQKDYQAFLASDTKETYNKLNQDLERLKGLT